MYAIIEDGGKQYKVEAGDRLLIELRELPEGQHSITFDKVLMIGDGAQSRVGAPFVDGAAVSATLLETLKTDKVRGVKFARRKGLYKRWGHRQTMMKVSIDAING